MTLHSKVAMGVTLGGFKSVIKSHDQAVVIRCSIRGTGDADEQARETGPEVSVLDSSLENAADN